MRRRLLASSLFTTALASLVLLGSGCYLQHGGPVWTPDREARTIGIPPVISHLRTDELTRSLEARLTAELRRRASQGDLGGLQLSEAAGADVVLVVEITAVNQRVIRSDLYNVPLERGVVIQTSYRLTDRAGPALAEGTADSRVTALAGDYDISRGQEFERGRTSAIAAAAQSIIEAIDDDRTRPPPGSLKPTPAPDPASAAAPAASGEQPAPGLTGTGP